MPGRDFSCLSYESELPMLPQSLRAVRSRCVRLTLYQGQIFALVHYGGTFSVQNDDRVVQQR